MIISTIGGGSFYFIASVNAIFAHFFSLHTYLDISKVSFQKILSIFDNSLPYII